MDKNIKIRHIRDVYNPERVMTLLTRNDGDGKVSYAYAVNKPTEWKTTLENSCYRAEVLEKGDQFSRRKGVEIATGRLDCDRTRTTIEVKAEEHPYRAVLAHILTAETGVVKRIAEFELEEFEYVQDFKEAIAQYETALLTEEN